MPKGIYRRVIKKKPIKKPTKRKTTKKSTKKVVKTVIKQEPKVRKPRIQTNVATEYPPLTSEEQLQRTRKEQNALNKSRSKVMENRVAKVLQGRRVLLSGAANAYKGDVEVRFNNYPGGYIVECKLSSQSKDRGPYIIMKHAWFPKMHEEAKNMGSKFAVLIINFLGKTRDYVFIRKDIVELLIHRYNVPYADTLSKLLYETKLIDGNTNTKGKVLITYTFYKDVIESNLTTIDMIAGVRFSISDGEYLVIHIDNFAKIVENL